MINFIADEVIKAFRAVVSARAHASDMISRIDAGQTFSANALVSSRDTFIEIVKTINALSGLNTATGGKVKTYIETNSDFGGDAVTHIAGIRSAAQAVVDHIESAFPVHDTGTNRWLLLYEWDSAGGFRTRSFTAAQLSTYRTRLDAYVAAV